MTRIFALALGLMALGLLLSLGGSVALAEGEHGGHGAKTEAPTAQTDRGGMGHMGMEMGKSGMQRGMDMHDMHARVQALHDHSKMMEGMTDQKALAEEMKKHMRMMDEMMEKMMTGMMAETPMSGDM